MVDYLTISLLTRKGTLNKLANLPKQDNEPDAGTVQNIYFPHPIGSGGKSLQPEKMSNILQYASTQIPVQNQFPFKYIFFPT